MERVIGTDFLLVASNQDGENGVDHTMASGEQVLVGDRYLTKNLRANKVFSIAHEIGRRPVLAFGNSGGDIAMGTYTLDNPDHEGQAFMLLCDDTERDYGDTGVAEALAAHVGRTYRVLEMARWYDGYRIGVLDSAVVGMPNEYLMDQIP